MWSRCGTLLLILMACAVSVFAQAAGAPRAAQAEPVRTDALGDPLPPGARARLGSLRYRHTAIILSLALSPDGKLLAAGGVDYVVRLWDRATGKPLRALTDLPNAVTAVAFSP